MSATAARGPGRFWPVAEAAQADYEQLRRHVLEIGTPPDSLPDSLPAARFARRGLSGLIAWPAADPVFHAELVGATRPPWTPHADPREEALAASYGLLFELAAELSAPNAREKA